MVVLWDQSGRGAALEKCLHRVKRPKYTELRLDWGFPNWATFMWGVSSSKKRPISQYLWTCRHPSSQILEEPFDQSPWTWAACWAPSSTSSCCACPPSSAALSSSQSGSHHGEFAELIGLELLDPDYLKRQGSQKDLPIIVLFVLTYQIAAAQ